MLRAEELRKSLDGIRKDEAGVVAALDYLRTNCVDHAPHAWGDVQFTPEHREGYVIPSDLDRGVNLGVDTIVSRTHVPPETINEWTRRCAKCGTEEHTRETSEVRRPGSVAGTTAVERVPKFS